MTGEKRRHVRAFRFFSVLLRPAMRILLRFRGETIPDPGGPVFVLCNHNTDLDCILLGLSARRQIYFVATETVARMGMLGWLVRRYFDPILHRKGVQGAATVRAILSRIRDGSSVALFPEGNRSFNGLTCPIPPATGKLTRICGATLITYRLTGGYFTSPRWGRGLRRGRLTGKVEGVYSPDDLKSMSAADLGGQSTWRGTRTPWAASTSWVSNLAIRFFIVCVEGPMYGIFNSSSTSGIHTASSGMPMMSSRSEKK